MGVDVHMRWKGQTEAETHEGYARGYGAGQVLFRECWEEEVTEDGQETEADGSADPAPGSDAPFSTPVGEETEPGDEDSGPRIIVADSPEGVGDLIDEEETDELIWKPFPAALLREREKAARRHTWRWVKEDMTAGGETDGEETHLVFLQRWLPYKRLIVLAERKEAETGEPVEVSVSY